MPKKAGKTAKRNRTRKPSKRGIQVRDLEAKQQVKGSLGGDKLIAHELTHTVRQGG